MRTLLGDNAEHYNSTRHQHTPKNRSIMNRYTYLAYFTIALPGDGSVLFSTSISILQSKGKAKQAIPPRAKFSILRKNLEKPPLVRPVLTSSQC